MLICCLWWKAVLNKSDELEKVKSDGRGIGKKEVLRLV